MKLVLYYTRTGNTKLVAEEIAKQEKADIEEIKEGKDRKGVIGYVAAGRDAMQKKASEIKPLESDLSKYDTIYIGQPVWAWNAVPAVRGLLKKYDFKGKRVALFCTMNSSGDDGCFKETRKLLLGAKMLGDKAFVKPKKDKDLAMEVKGFISSHTY